MESTAYSARRATPEDLPALQLLWQSTGMPWEQLGSFINEFQVATDENEQLVGAIGMMVEESHALLHSESVHPDFDPDLVRLSLWRRMQIIARNKGVQFLWTQEDAAYWLDSGFRAASGSEIQSCRASFMDPSAAWRVFPMADPSRVQDVLQEQFAILEATRLQESEDFQKRIKAFRLFAYLLGLVVLAGLFLLLFIVAQKSPDRMGLLRFFRGH